MGKSVQNISVGIDLGTTASVVSVLENDGAHIRVLDIDGTKTKGKTQKTYIFPSAVNLVHGLQGLDALDEKVISKTYRNLKRNFIEAAEEEVNEPGKGAITPYEYQKILLNALYDEAVSELENEEGIEVNFTSVTVTVPTDFKTAHRSLMQKLVKETKWGKAKNIQILDEPIAASLAKLHQDPDTTGNWLTFDLGGGTFDISLLETFDVDGEITHKVQKNAGDLFLGGVNFDEEVWKLAKDSIEENDILEKMQEDEYFEKDLKEAFHCATCTNC